MPSPLFVFLVGEARWQEIIHTPQEIGGTMEML